MVDLDESPVLSDKDRIRQHEVESQLAALRSPSPNIRAAAARRLGDLQSGLDELLDALHDPSEYVRSAASMALGSFAGHERAGEISEFLLAEIDDASEKVCQSAIRSLGMLHARETRPEIEEFLDDPNPYILGSAVLTLARFGADDLAPRLARYLNHESSYVKTQAARAAATLKYAPAGPEIIRLLKATRAARLAEGFSDPVAGIDRREDDLFNLQNQLVRAAGELRLEDAVPLLIEIAQKDIGFRGLAVEALIAIGADIAPEMLAGLLADPSIYLRKRLVYLMIQHNYRPALPLIRTLLDDENATIRVAALQAITQMADAGSLPRVAWMSFHDSNPFIRVQAVEALAALEGPASMQRLVGLAADANFQVRRCVAAYLLQWQSTDPQALLALSRFVSDFPTDELAPTIQSFLDQQAYSPSQDAPLEPAMVLVPPEVQSSANDLLASLEDWRQSLRRDPQPARQEAEAALDYLIDILRRIED